MDNSDTAERPIVTAAQGWLRIQLAALGFIGFCGALWASGDSSAPRWLQWLAAALAVGALALACLAVVLVGQIAYPAGMTAGNQAIRLRAGIRTTFVAIAVLGIATLSAWWPPPAEQAATVEVRSTAGQAWCGSIVDAPAGTVRVSTADGPVALRLNQVTALRPVSHC